MEEKAVNKQNSKKGFEKIRRACSMEARFVLSALDACLKQQTRLGQIKVSISSDSSAFDQQQTQETPLGLTGMWPL